MSREQVHWLDMGPWPQFVGLCFDEAVYAREMKRLGEKESPPFIQEDANAAVHHLPNLNTSILCIRKPSRRQTKEQYAALVAHEAVHIAQEVRERLDDKMGREGEAYFVQSIVQDCLQLAWATGRVRRLKPRPQP